MIHVYTDGSIGVAGNRRGNKEHPAAWAFVAVYKDTIIKESKGIVELNGCSPDFIGAKHWTNNTAELSGIYWALLYLHERGANRGIVYTDSKYALDAIKGNSSVSANKTLIKTIRQLYFPHVEKYQIRWVKGHADNQFNEKADQLAKAAVNEATRD